MCARVRLRWGRDGGEGGYVRSWGDLKHGDGTPNHLIFFTDCFPQPWERIHHTSSAPGAPRHSESIRGPWLTGKGLSLEGWGTRVARGEGCWSCFYFGIMEEPEILDSLWKIALCGSSVLGLLKKNEPFAFTGCQWAISCPVIQQAFKTVGVYNTVLQ